MSSLQQLVLRLDVYVPGGVWSNKLSTSACAAPRRVCCLQHPELHVCVSVYKSPVHASLYLCVYSKTKLLGMFRNRYICFRFFDTCSKHQNKSNIFLYIFFGWLECVDNSFAYIGHFVFYRCLDSNPERCRGALPTQPPISEPKNRIIDFLIP